MGDARSWLETGMLVAALAALGVAIWSHRKATFAQVVTHYAERFCRVRNGLPAEGAPEPSAKCTLTGDAALRPYLDYFDLTYEEWYMSRHGYLPKSLWRVWKKDVHALMRSPAIGSAWRRVSAAYRDDADFFAFMEEMSRN